jgi:membrane-associated phospholipid phosphatase
VTLSTRRSLPRILAWSVAVALTGCVAVSRIYRGDHHLTDAVAGLVLGVAAVSAAGLACRAWAESASYRADNPATDRAAADRAAAGTPTPAVPERHSVGQA